MNKQWTNNSMPSKKLMSSSHSSQEEVHSWIKQMFPSIWKDMG